MPYKNEDEYESPDTNGADGDFDEDDLVEEEQNDTDFDDESEDESSDDNL
jgi:hypothetical protein